MGTTGTPCSGLTKKRNNVMHCFHVHVRRACNILIHHVFIQQFIISRNIFQGNAFPVVIVYRKIYSLQCRNFENSVKHFSEVETCLSFSVSAIHTFAFLSSRCQTIPKWLEKMLTFSPEAIKGCIIIGVHHLFPYTTSS